MLTPAWYLTDGDYVAEPPAATQTDAARSATGAAATPAPPAYTLHEHASWATASTGLTESHRRPGRATFVHAPARLTPDQRRAIGLRYLDGYPRDAAARLTDRSIEAVRCLQRRAIRRIQAILVGACGSTATAVTS